MGLTLLLVEVSIEIVVEIRNALEADLLLEGLGGVENLSVVHLVCQQIALVLSLSTVLLALVLGLRKGRLIIAESGGVAEDELIVEAVALVEFELVYPVARWLVH